MWPAKRAARCWALAPGTAGPLDRCGRHLDHPNWDLPENGASVHLHERADSRWWGAESARKAERCLADVLLLERRSKVVD